MLLIPETVILNCNGYNQLNMSFIQVF